MFGIIQGEIFNERKKITWQSELSQYKVETMNKYYDYLIVGSGLFGAVFASEMKKRGKKTIVIERRNHVGGNIYTERTGGIDVHKYGPHIFHTSKKDIWDYANEITFFKPFTLCPLANFRDKLYNLPFNMHTFYQMWGVTTPAQAMEKLAKERAEYADITPTNLEEQALKSVGRDIYEKLIKGYTEKQWGRKCNELPPFIIRRLPLRLIFDNNYFNDTFQGIPAEGYTVMINKLLEGIEVRLCTDFFADRKIWLNTAEKIIFTGRIDEFFDERFGTLEYRSLRFEHETLAMENYQGAPVVNFTDATIPYTRITEHKHFSGAKANFTIISREYPAPWKPGDEPYYPINDQKNNLLYQKYAALAKETPNVIFGGRLGAYRYFNMDEVLETAIAAAKTELNNLSVY